MHLLGLKPDTSNPRVNDVAGEQGGSNSNMSTGSDYSPAVGGDSADKIGRIKVSFEHQC